MNVTLSWNFLQLIIDEAATNKLMSLALMHSLDIAKNSVDINEGKFAQIVEASRIMSPPWRLDLLRNTSIFFSSLHSELTLENWFEEVELHLNSDEAMTTIAKEWAVVSEVFESAKADVIEQDMEINAKNIAIRLAVRLMPLEILPHMTLKEYHQYAKLLLRTEK